MSRRIKSPDDLHWLLRHTHGFRGGKVSDVHVHKQRLFDEASGREVAVGTTITIVIRYEHIPSDDPMLGVSRVAKLSMRGVSDFSVFEQEGADFSEIGVLHAEATGGRLRFWFDPHGELYVICDEVDLDEVSRPRTGAPMRTGTSEWTFQARAGELPEINWFLAELDRAGMPCAWRGARPTAPGHPALRWAGLLIPADSGQTDRSSGVQVQTYGALDGAGFGITLRASDPHEAPIARLLIILADLIARSFSGLCLARNQVLERDEWLAR
jgi:hypothetical protein